ncbi:MULTISPECIES: ABC transporter ATP-binding protein [unclassified Mesorhizobium]|uniref:ABC transporter ATP-binding protein n=1 Tax=unclassified Mesorhizobium TaxID=325217 RepID=UPI000BB0618F|nr:MULTISPECIES: ABC transporter ATP-binding protein [unclassified Mesorhizobium]PBB87458.1 ABC transporter ATP-binding protein [Mesorhizobium sp. WSM3876]RWB74282.1 MAG: ABC transporter ATP-binding protein [Mesorhizobium sp.]RWB88377.1 MAG: ABC transporter ATP-binding protein [Mesorhizobium sp.]RWE27790.1 MAG: ABC transporter ATP-binding protein [Mesorhizobium sp.]
MSFDKFQTDDRDQNVAIRVRNVSKHYVMFERPEDRFKQMVVPRLERLIGRPPRRYFRDFAALSDVTFEIGKGETVGIIGRNGSGKSTLLQIICGTLQPTSGAVEVNGRIAALLELGAGFNPEFTGRENVFLNASILGVPRKEMEWRFDDIARFADIGPFIDQPVKTYSSGMYVRLAFATAINVDPDILVVDEALAVGDEAFQRKCFARIEDIKDKGGTILFVSHGAQTIVQLCTRAMLIDAGELILEGRPKTIVGQYQRLVNASAEAAKEIRAAITSLTTAISTPQVIGIDDLSARHSGPDPKLPNLVTDSLAELSSASSSLGRTEADAVIVSAVETKDEPISASELYADYYDPNLSSKSTVYLEERGACIRDMRVTTLSGEQVNVLQMGRRYVFEYTVDFTADAKEVGFEFLFKSVTGLVLAGSDTHRAKRERTQFVSGGTSLQISFTFSCLMLPGVYLASAGVRGMIDDEFRMLHKIVEGVLIRVASEPDLVAIGCVNLDATPQVALSPAKPLRH